MKQPDLANRDTASLLACPLCGKETLKWSEDGLISQDGRPFFRCRVCHLVYCSPEEHPSLALEALRYSQHDNDPHDPNYLRFLRRVLEPVSSFITAGMKALDYGSGPGPGMAILLKMYDIPCTLYDPIYAPDLPVGPFDIITSTETFEHFHRPASSLEHIVSLLKPGGLLCIMTEQWTDISRFSKWYYTRDDTHVCFYHSRTFEWIADAYGLNVLHNDGKRVVCMQKT